ncbi:hypothetical protein SLU01_04450 [Sporosarcina luteola]|uniref:Copper amine oxidase-like N-terminal domain-containing protein n=1 Tax=Sporosarcina luteola TaxID=582850 RepID=A0A511Z3V6_9BACL|nr:hypothetical protein [Sporosarcina luteola]GEN82133.1 hypothetical protein SLU01_04450 [Sporosarcina luteola]
MKIIIRTVILLFIMNLALLYMHYSQLADAKGDSEEVLQYVQEIEVINRKDSLIVRQHFRKLDSRRHEIILPTEGKEFTCFMDTDSSCSRINDNVTAFLEGDEDRQSISYEIPKSDSMVNRKLFKEPFAALKNAVPVSTMLHVTDETGIGGMWVSGLEFVGSKKMNMVDYSLFKGEGQVTDLYWQHTELPIAYKGSNLSILGQPVDEESAAQLNNDLMALNADHLIIAIDPKGKQLQTDRFIITNQKLSAIANTVVEKGVQSQFVLSTAEDLVANLITSILIDSPAGKESARRAFGELKENLTVDQYEALRNLVSAQRGAPMDAVKLDGLIGEVSGFKTSFVQQNSIRKYPFHFEDNRPAVINGELQEDVQIVVKDGRTLYPAKQVLTANGYTVSSNERSIYIESEAEKFRFSLRDSFYVLNEKKYTLRDFPFELIGDDYYFEEDALRRLFHLSIQKHEDKISITSLVEGESK